MGPSDTHRPSRHRGVAMLLALLYGVLAGGGLVPASATAQPAGISSLSEHAVLTTTGKNRGAAVKAPRSSPDLGFVPASPLPIWSLTTWATGRTSAPPPLLAASSGAASYRARAPPAA